MFSSSGGNRPVVRRDPGYAPLIVGLANGRCDHENGIEQLKNGVNAMRMPVNDLLQSKIFLWAAARAEFLGQLDFEFVALETGPIQFGDDRVGVFGRNIHEKMALADVHGANAFPG